MPPTARDRLIDAALELFQREGFHATGIERILSEAGVARMTLYNHFHSKEELILAAVRRADERFRRWFKQEVRRRAKTPRERLLAIFDVQGEWHRSPRFHGCVFSGAASEYTDQEHPVHAACAEHKRLMLHWVRSLAEEAGAKDPQETAGTLCLLMDGATCRAATCGDADAAAFAKEVAESLLPTLLSKRSELSA